MKNKINIPKLYTENINENRQFPFFLKENMHTGITLQLYNDSTQNRIFEKFNYKDFYLEEPVKIKNDKIFPEGTFASKIKEEYNIKYIPLDKNRKIKDQFSFADIVYLELTRGCNLRCKHCLNNSGEVIPNQLNEKEFEDLHSLSNKL